MRQLPIHADCPAAWWVCEGEPDDAGEVHVYPNEPGHRAALECPCRPIFNEGAESHPSM